MTQEYPYSCYIIGSSDLLKYCAEFLEEQHFQILGIITDDQYLTKWAEEKTFPVFPTNNLFVVISEAKECDYLFSIANKKIIPEKLLPLLKKGAINYHDALLPKYGGVNATSWAILNDEKKHGITWHYVEKGIDTGAILKQKAIAIDKNETAFSLTIKCQEAALFAFKELVLEIINNIVRSKCQNLSKRTYYSLRQKPFYNGIINWFLSAEEIYRYFRACKVAGYPNVFSVQKMAIGKEILIIEDMVLLSEQFKGKPGTLLKIQSNGLTINTGNGLLLLRKLKDCSNKEITAQEVIKKFKINEGNILVSPNKLLCKKIQRLSEKYFHNEKYWVKEFIKYREITYFPYFKLNWGAIENEGSNGKCHKSALLNSFKKLSDYEHKKNYAFEIVAISIIYTYLYRINHSRNFTFLFCNDQLREKTKGIFPYFYYYLPLNIKFNEGSNFDEFLKSVSNSLMAFDRHGLCLADIFTRYAQLNPAAKNVPISVCVFNYGDDINAIFPKTNIQIFINKAKQEVTLLINKKCVLPGHLKFICKTIDDDLEKLINSVLNNNFLQFNLGCVQELSAKQAVKKQNISSRSSLLTIHRLFEKTVKNHPFNVAVFSKKEQINYLDLNKKSNQLANFLLNSGVGIGDFVAICLNKSIGLIVAILAILKIRAAYVPLDPNLPSERIHYILNDLGNPIVITRANENFFNNFIEYNRLICIDKYESSISSQPNKNLSFSGALNDLAYVLYTSGSTGKPKGVLIEHEGPINTTFAQITAFGISSFSRILSFASFAFDASVSELLTALLSGAALCMPEEEGLFPGERLAKTINEMAINVVTLPPSVIFKTDFSICRDLKTLVSAGEACSLSILRKLNLDQFNFINAYGPTEASICVTMTKPIKTSQQISIGQPIDGVSCYVLDEQLNSLPKGVVGELHVAGRGLARGYFKKPELSKEKFIHNSFISRERLYKTGDLVRRLPDGDLEYVGRIDSQIKIRGFRVELGEIEANLREYPGVDDVAVVLQKAREGEDYLVAYLACKNRMYFNVSKMKKRLQKFLPDYMLPSAFLLAERLPTTISRKIDRKQLTKEINNNVLIAKQNKKEHIELEKELILIWRRILIVQRVDVYDDFFNVGGNSLLITDLLAAISQKFHVQVEIAEFLQNPTIANLVYLISKKENLLANDTHKATFKSDIKSAYLGEAKHIRSSSFSSEILLTGSSGFLGGSILLEVLKQYPDKNIYCLVRGKNIREGRERILQNLRFFGQFSQYEQERIIPVLGDLTQPNLGISKKIYEKLISKIDTIFHCAAKVNHLYSYQHLRMPNVLGTIHLMKLALSLGVDKFYYISTMSAAEVSNRECVEESFLLDQDYSFEVTNGYTLTKLASEIILAKAKMSNLNIYIHRPAWIFGDSKSGYFPYLDNHLFLLLKSCMQLGYAPAWDAYFNILPVDFISKFITRSLGNVGESSIFNLYFSSASLSWTELINYLKQNGYSINLINPDDWRNNFLVNLPFDNALYPLLPLYLDNNIKLASHGPKMSKEVINQNFISLVKKNGLELPAMALELFEKSFLYAKKKGFFECEEC